MSLQIGPVCPKVIASANDRIPTTAAMTPNADQGNHGQGHGVPLFATPFAPRFTAGNSVRFRIAANCGKKNTRQFIKRVGRGFSSGEHHHGIAKNNVRYKDERHRVLPADTNSQPPERSSRDGDREQEAADKQRDPLPRRCRLHE